MRNDVTTTTQGGMSMKNEHHDSPQRTPDNPELSNAAHHPVKRAWRSPELTEVDYEITEFGPGAPSGDFVTYGS
jgi:hypothetical protein